MNLTGKWQGEYTFVEDHGDKEAASVAGQVVSFTLDFHQGWLGALSGTAEDDKRTGFKETGKIKGKIKGNFLEFRRLMPVLRLMHERWLSLEDWAQRRKLVVDTEIPHPHILHDGTLSDDGNSIEGEWKMNSSTIEVPGSYMSLPLPAVGGTWKVKRV